MKNLKSFIAAAVANGGATYHLVEGDVSNTQNWAVAVPEHEVFVAEAQDLPKFVKQFVLLHSEKLGSEFPRYCIGLWNDSTKFVLDLVELFPTTEYTEEGIREIGRLRKQTSVFNLETMTEVNCFDILHRKGDYFWTVSPAGARLVREWNFKVREDKVHFGDKYLSLDDIDLLDCQLNEAASVGLYAANL